MRFLRFLRWLDDDSAEKIVASSEKSGFFFIILFDRSSGFRRILRLFFCVCVCVCGKTGRRDAFWRSPVPLLPPALLGFPIFLYLSLCSSLRTHPYQVVSFCHLSFCLLSWFSDAHCFLLRKRFVFVGKRRLFYYFSLSFFRFLL